jgi:hypothetical protein
MQLAANIACKPRLAELDMIKGFLVLLMVVYHSINYTIQLHLSYRYLSFLPLSFILITGFLLSTVYFHRVGEKRLAQRLLFRGVRLLVLFTLLNIMAQYVRSPVYGQSVGVTSFFHNWWQIYFTGGSQLAAFDVLLPIAYLLLVAPLLLDAAHRAKLFLPLASGISLVICALSDFQGVSSANFSFMIAGMLGMLTGQLFPDLSKLGRFLPLTILLYSLYFPLGVARGWLFIVQVLGGFIALALIGAASVRAGSSGWWKQRLIRIGQYSLISYITQIALLQILSRFIGRPQLISLDALLLFSATLLFTVVAAEALKWLRERSVSIDTAYKVVFG